MPSKKRQETIAPVLSDRGRQLVRSLIGSMIGYEDTTVFQVTEIKPDNLPLNMQTSEGYVLDALYRCRYDGFPPTRENVIQVLKIEKKMAEPEPLVDALITEGLADGFSVRELSSFVGNVLQEHRGVVVGDEIARIFNEPSAEKYADRYERAYELLSRATPLDSDLTREYSEESLMSAFLLDQATIADARKRGEDVGPNFPFESAQAFIARLKPGEFSTILAQTGAGKTTLAMRMAEHIAWKQKIKTNVVYMTCETDPILIQRRQMSCHYLIPFKAMEEGVVDFREDPWRGKVEDFMTKSRTRSDLYGHIHYVHMDGPRIESVLATMERAARIAKASGRRIVFILDYLQKIGWWLYDRERYQVYEMAGEQFAAHNRRINKYVSSHFILLAQENNDGEAFGSSVIRKISQVAVSIQREGPATADHPVLGNGVHLKDALGQPRYWHRAGDELMGKADLKMTKANDAQMGVMNTLFEGPLNKMIQDPDQLKKLRAMRLIP